MADRSRLHAKMGFIKFVRACSVEKTVHQDHFINWNEYVYGSSRMDWAANQEECIRMYREFKIRLNMTKKLFSEMLGDLSLLQFFEGEEYVNRLNDINICLSSMFKARFEDYFLSDENGKPLNRLKGSGCDSVVNNFFNQSPTMFRTAFSFNDNLDVQIT